MKKAILALSLTGTFSLSLPCLAQSERQGRDFLLDTGDAVVLAVAKAVCAKPKVWCEAYTSGGAAGGPLKKSRLCVTKEDAAIPNCGRPLPASPHRG